MWQPYLNDDIFRRLRQVAKHSPFQTEVIKLIVKIFHDCQDMTIRAKIFGLMDYYNNGCVNKIELKRCFEDHGIKVDYNECQSIIDKMFIRTEGAITYTEFLAATLDKKYFLEDSYVKVAFDRIDLNQSGAIKIDDIGLCFERFGYRLSQ